MEIGVKALISGIMFDFGIVCYLELFVRLSNCYYYVDLIHNLVQRVLSSDNRSIGFVFLKRLSILELRELLSIQKVHPNCTMGKKRINH